MKFQRFLYLFFLLLLSVSSSQAYKFYAGGRDGWVLNPSENYNHWAERNRFQVNDTLFFEYKNGSDSVLLVNKDDYYNCKTTNPIKKLDSEFKFDRSGPFFFISGTGDHCEKGQKLIVVVLAVRHNNINPNPPPPSIPRIAPSPQVHPPISPSPKSPTGSPSSSPSPSPSPSPSATTPSPTSSSSPVPAPSSVPFSPSPTTQSPAATPESSPSPSPETSSGPSPTSPGGITPSPSASGGSITSPPPQAENQNSYAGTVTPSSVLVSSVILLVTVLLTRFVSGVAI